MPVTCVERSLVDTWRRPGDLTLPAVRAAVITAVRRRMCRPLDLAIELERRPQLRAGQPAVRPISASARCCARNSSPGPPGGSAPQTRTSGSSRRAARSTAIASARREPGDSS
jgi:hypothetical protein